MPNSFSAIKKAILSLDWLDFPCKACRVKRPSKSSSLTNKSEKKCFQQILVVTSHLITHYVLGGPTSFAKSIKITKNEKNRESLFTYSKYHEKRKKYIISTQNLLWHPVCKVVTSHLITWHYIPGFKAEMRATNARPSRHEEPKFSTWMPNLGVIISLHHCNKAFLAPTFQPLDLRLGSETADECWPWESEYICFVFSSICKV